MRESLAYQTIGTQKKLTMELIQTLFTIQQDMVWHNGHTGAGNRSC